jgi:hypothetical protein
VNDLIHSERRGEKRRIVAVPGGEFLRDAMQPFIELGRRARVERGERSDNARLALGDDEIGIGDEKQRRADDGKAKLVMQDRRENHRFDSCGICRAISLAA